MLFVGSPMCTAFSTWQRTNNMSGSPVTVHLEFRMDLYCQQIKEGRYFLHEHPAHASLWQNKTVDAMRKRDDVIRATCDQCAYGCGPEDREPITKPIRFMTNARELAQELSVRCSGQNGECSRPGGCKHEQCRGNKMRDQLLCITLILAGQYCWDSLDS